MRSAYLIQGLRFHAKKIDLKSGIFRKMEISFRKTKLIIAIIIIARAPKVYCIAVQEEEDAGTGGERRAGLQATVRRRGDGRLCGRVAG